MINTFTHYYSIILNYKWKDPNGFCSSKNKQLVAGLPSQQAFVLQNIFDIARINAISTSTTRTLNRFEF